MNKNSSKNTANETVTDIDGNTYKIIRIKEQIWMAENLNVAHYKNGDSIPEVQNNDEWSKLTTGAWCYYKNNIENSKKYGKLYNWHAVNDPRGLAPKGWHLPTKDELDILSSSCGWAQNLVYEALIKGGSSGFNSLFGNCRNNYGDFLNLGRAFFWSASMDNPDTAFDLTIDSADESAGIYYDDQGMGFSVRCVRD